ncbi:hypothetical protein NKR19_g9474 [Coniochaeta hoffmannii]|uniref:Transcription factor domain-containing protein n=1 Tax=Coniochaeta hoffmannii TaxID=91930 RepID=A0AA38R3K0_9PEZI|nr:hypothetical protein NKR19_g9474 [Coniochaeta hoffmannii]
MQELCGYIPILAGAEGGFELTTLATILLLSMTEVFEARSPEDWVKHLGAAGKIIADRLSRRKHPLDRSTHIFLDIFAYHNVLVMVATGGGQPSLDQAAALIDRLSKQLRSWAPPEGTERDTSSTVEALRQVTLILYHNLAHIERGGMLSNAIAMAANSANAAEPPV